MTHGYNQQIPTANGMKIKQEAHQLVGQAKRRPTKIQPKATEGSISAVCRTSRNADRKKMMTSYPVRL